MNIQTILEQAVSEMHPMYLLWPDCLFRFVKTE